jgi:uncharacterized protein YidB (DUF937 family)
MGILDALLGGKAADGTEGSTTGRAATGVALVTLAGSLIERAGGVSGLLNLLHQHGMGTAAQSWVGTGANQPVSSDQLAQALQSGGLGSMVSEAAAKMGTTPGDLLGDLSHVLPHTVDHMTPGGQVLDHGAGGLDLNSIGALAGKLFGER